MTFDAAELLRDSGPARVSRYRRFGVGVVMSGDNLLIQRTRKVFSADISEHRPEDLRLLDGFLNDEFRRVIQRTKPSYDTVSIALGCYLGEVFLRNLTGRWHLPNPLQALIGLISPRPFDSFARYFYVIVHGKNIHVFRWSRQAIDRTSRGFSLYKFYRNIEAEIAKQTSGEIARHGTSG